MFIELDLQSETPIYAQLVDQIIEGIASGALQPGDPLPSVRSLAEDLGINLHTVNKSYNLLKQEGFLQVHRKKGVVVQPDGMPGMTEAFEEKLRRQLRSLAAEAAVRGMTEEAFAQQSRSLYRNTITNRGGEQR
ncbi:MULTISPECIES: GntR family transcriptional regulator [unclassified Paenibacillus]|uniref:GntR family transcriptional regulator n=1 Tax=unclassified Paenibacillus TaxID=185978 RepID=UPI001C113AFB|nr:MULTISPECIES: GntR family transcriptional regulator [unclassified Paenibacillus]MBU5441879.1 GntR family transcriptional regulator [Paenibacillus sp. MSJ-34]CAH0122806.1 HTH-type transcriptional repressor YtrA [Paenibacillus sp. CECT 9249]